ncbi:MAG: hypothetical protein P4L64_08250 [Caulobacteraceae bacterium]|nr:hypothetical protein [Caulobacteraceae bacterium]
MFRTSAIALGLAILAGSANAAEFKVLTADKSPAELRAAVSDAAFKACKAAYAGDVFAVYERDGCVKETVETALTKANLGSETASTAPRGAVIATR